MAGSKRPPPLALVSINTSGNALTSLINDDDDDDDDDDDEPVQ